MLHLAVCYGFLWILMDSYGFLWILMDSYGFFGILWDSLGFFGILWDSLEFLWILWNSHVFFGILWDSLHTMGEIASIGFKSQLFLNSSQIFWSFPLCYGIWIYLNLWESSGFFVVFKIKMMAWIRNGTKYIQIRT